MSVSVVQGVPREWIALFIGSAIMVVWVAWSIWTSYRRECEFSDLERSVRDHAADEEREIRNGVAAERARWKPVTRYGCHEYQQHEDGRRRAVRVVEGEDVLDRTWLVEGAGVEL